MTTYPLFLYGTLRTGGALANSYIHPDTPRIAATIPGRLWTYPGFGYPFADVYGPGTIAGEIAEVTETEWQQMAAMETAAGYHIVSVQADTDDGPHRVILFHQPFDRRYGVTIDGGDWMAHDHSTVGLR